MERLDITILMGMAGKGSALVAREQRMPFVQNKIANPGCGEILAAPPG